MTRINLSSEGLFINEVHVVLPTNLETLSSALGGARHTIKQYNQLYTWDSLGIIAYSKDGTTIEHIHVQLTELDVDFAPIKLFEGEFLFAGQDIQLYYKTHKQERVKLFGSDNSKALAAGDVSAWFSIHKQHVSAIELSHYEKTDVATYTPFPLTTDYLHYTDLWKRFLDVVTSTVYEDNEYVNVIHGISSADLEKTQKQLPEELPAALVNFYKVQDVDWHPVTSAISFRVNGYDYDLLPFKKLAQEWGAIMNLQFEDSLEDELLEAFDARVKSKDYSNPKWIPFAEGRNGDYLLVDTDPSPLGKYGQIVELKNESWERNVVAGSLTELVEKEIIYIQNHAETKYAFILENDEEDD